MNLLMVRLFCLALGTVAVGEAAAKKVNGLLSASEAVKVVEQSVGTDVLPVDFLSTKNGAPYYRITVDHTAKRGEKSFLDSTRSCTRWINSEKYLLGRFPAKACARAIVPALHRRPEAPRWCWSRTAGASGR